MPGIDSISSRIPSPATTKAGWIRCEGESSVSRTMPRRTSFCRRRRIRVLGKGIYREFREGMGISPLGLARFARSEYPPARGYPHPFMAWQ